MCFTILILSVFSKKRSPMHIKFFINKNTKTSMWAEKQAHTPATQKAPHELSLFAPQSSTPGIRSKCSPLDPPVSTAPPTDALRNYTVHLCLSGAQKPCLQPYSSSSTGEGLRGQTPCRDSQLTAASSHLKFKGFPASSEKRTVAGNECGHCYQTVHTLI